MSDEQAFITSYVVDDDIVVLRLHGKFDNSTAPEFDAEVEKRFEEGATKMIIDGAYLDHISSYGLGKLISLQGKLRHKGGTVKLCGLYSVVAEVMKVTNLDKLFDIHGDIEFARESFYE